MGKTRTIRLPLLDEEREIRVQEPAGKAALVAILPAARRLSAEAVSAAIAAVERVGRRVSCKAGCTACCRQLIPVSAIEARALGALVSRLPEARRVAIRRRFDALVAKLEQAGIVPAKGTGPRTALVSSSAGADASGRWANVNERYVALRLDCPFLESGRCSIYDDRPFVCREYMVTSDPRHCESVSAEVEPTPRPLYMTPALAEVAREFDGDEPPTIALPLLFEWLETRTTRASSDHEVASMFDMLESALIEQLDVDSG
jgi:Fe-S-cluster containining protein